jgi:hypothetical protein
MGRIRAVRDGRLNDPRFHSRMTGSGIFAEQVHALFELACRRAGLAGEAPPLSTRSTTEPPAARSRELIRPALGADTGRLDYPRPARVGHAQIIFPRRRSRHPGSSTPPSCWRGRAARAQAPSALLPVINIAETPPAGPDRQPARALLREPRGLQRTALRFARGPRDHPPRRRPLHGRRRRYLLDDRVHPAQVHAAPRRSASVLPGKETGCWAAEGMSRQAFVDHWLHVHVLALASRSGISQYVRAWSRPGSERRALDGIAEVHYGTAAKGSGRPCGRGSASADLAGSRRLVYPVSEWVRSRRGGLRSGPRRRGPRCTPETAAGRAQAITPASSQRRTSPCSRISPRRPKRAPLAPPSRSGRNCAAPRSPRRGPGYQPSRQRRAAAPPPTPPQCSGGAGSAGSNITGPKS